MNSYLQTKYITELKSTMKDYIALMKPKVILLVSLTGIAGIAAAPGKISMFLKLLTIICIGMGAAGSAVFNMWYDRDIDKIMPRTQNRPLAQNRINPDQALRFGIIISVLPTITLCLFVNILSGILLLISILTYTLLYTVILKRSSDQNIVLGGLAGCFPPLIGWSASTGTLSLAPWSLFLIIFFWTPAHFWSLALYIKDDYKLNEKDKTMPNIPMLPNTKGEIFTKNMIIIYTLLLILTSFTPYFLGIASIFWLGMAIFLGIKFISLSIKLRLDSNPLLPKNVFKFSILYLFLLFLGIIIDNIIIL